MQANLIPPDADADADPERQAPSVPPPKLTPEERYRLFLCALIVLCLVIGTVGVLCAIIFSVVYSVA